MNLENLIIEIYCRIEEKLSGLKLRSRGFPPKLTDAELITMEIVGHIMHQNCTQWIYRYFKNHWQEWFPNLGSRANFMKQSHHLSLTKQQLIGQLFPATSKLHTIDGLPLPICKYARSSRCKSMDDIANYGYCAAKSEHYYGLKAHIMIDHQQLITFVTLTASNVDERDVLENLCHTIIGHLLADKGYISAQKQELLQEHNIHLHTLKRENMPDDRPKTLLNFISKTRKRIETSFSILTEKFNITKTKARSMLSYASKIASIILAHNFYISLNCS